MASIREHEFPGRQVRFELAGLDPSAPPEETSGRALDALFGFSSGLLTPLRADLRLDVFDPEFGYPLETPPAGPAAWFLESALASPGVVSSPAWEGSARERVNAIDGDTLHRWVMAAVDEARARQDPGAPVVVGWREALVRAVRVRLPYSAAEMAAASLHIERGRHVIEYPIESIGDALFVSGPLEGKSVAGPFDLKASNDGGVLTMTIGVHWSLWTDREQRGWPDLLSAVGRLQSAGWQCTHSDIGGLPSRDV